MRKSTQVALALILALPAIAWTAGPVPTATQACDLLTSSAVRLHLSVRDLTGRYYCEDMGDMHGYFYLGLRYRTDPSEMVGSNLLGWFAVRGSDGKLFRWNVDNDVLTALDK
jgi:hypothetical protein